jgi:hypothetical protein
MDGGSDGGSNPLGGPVCGHAPVVGAGEGCGSYAECSPGLVCLRTICVQQAKVGDRCTIDPVGSPEGPTSQCGPVLVCSSGMCQEPDLSLCKL